MEQEIVERKLTTILSADVVGYSYLMGRDEAGTLAALKTHQKELLDPKAAQYHGRTVKLLGDGVLMEFGSVVDAVLFATEVQFIMRQRNADVAENRQIVFRVGINIGDIIVEGDDIYGDGVNVAARLEGLCQPGSICLSRTVFNHVKDKVDLTFEDMGEHQVKNIANPVLAYQIVLDDRAKALVTPVALQDTIKLPITARRYAVAASLVVIMAVAGLAWWQPWSSQFEPASIDRMALPLPDKPSLVVLPFEDFSDDPQNAYFADGMTEDLITDLSKISGIFVISRNSSWTYKDRAVKSQRVAEELGVQYILEGSVRRVGEQMRVNAQLIDALGGHHIWAERYDGDVKDVFALQDQALQEITAALAVQLTANEQAGIGESETDYPAAYDAVLLGLDQLRNGSMDDVADAIKAFEKAIEIDPDYSRAYAALAEAHWRIAQSVWLLAMGGGFEQSWRAMQKNLDRSLETPSALAHSLLAEILVAQGRHAEAYTELSKALALSPNDPDVHVAKANVLNATGRAAEAEAAVHYALRFDPHQATRYLRELGVAQLHQKKYEESAATMRRVLSRDSDVVADIVTLISALGHLGKNEQVPELIEQYNAIAVPSFYDAITAQESHYWWYGDMFGYDRDYRHHLIEGMVKADVPPSTGSDLDIEAVRDLISQREGLYYIRGVPRITTEEAKALYDDGQAKFIDVRAALDFEAGHMPGAINLSLPTALSRQSLHDIAAPSDTLIFSCHGPHCPYSVYAAAMASLWEFEDVHYYAGGFPAWADASYPITEP